MDIATIGKIIGIGKTFLGEGKSGGQEQSGPDLLSIYADVKQGPGKIALEGQQPMIKPGQAQQIQQVSYNNTVDFWNKLLSEYTRG